MPDELDRLRADNARLRAGIGVLPLRMCRRLIRRIARSLMDCRASAVMASG
jgi:hypothetical protein